MAAEDEVEIHDEGSDESTDEDMPDMDDGTEESSGKGKQSRSEKKSRKAMQKLGMKPVPGIIRVTVKKSKNILFIIKEPDVFKTSSDNPKAPATYIVGDDAPKIEAGGDDDDGDEDAGDIEEQDIKLVVSQAGVSRAKAIKALKEHDKDVVNAIMDLTGS